MIQFFDNIINAIDDTVEKFQARRYKLSSFDQELFNGIEAYLGKLRGRDAKWIETDSIEEMEEVKQWVMKEMGEKDSTILNLVIDKAADELGKARKKEDVRTPFLIYRVTQLLDKEHYFKAGKTPQDFLVEPEDDPSSSDQAFLWADYLTAITKSMDGVQPENVIAISNKIDCVLDDPSDLTANAQIYNVGDSIPGWGIRWNGQFQHKLFEVYQAWILDLNGSALAQPLPDTDDKQDQLSDLEQKLRDYGTGLTSLTRDIYDQYIQDWCMNPVQGDDNHYTCDASQDQEWIPGYPTFSDYKDDQLASGLFAQKKALLEQNLGQDLDGLNQQIQQLREDIYGSNANITLLTEAQTAVTYADPLASTTLTPAQKEQYQMIIKEGTGEGQVPRFNAGAGNSLNGYVQWVQDQKSTPNQPLLGPDANPQVVVSLDSTKKTDDGDSWKFDAHGGIPIDWFWLGASASGSGSHDEKTDYEFQATITFQDVKYVPLTPGDWFKSGLFGLFGDFTDWPSNSQFKDKDVFGPNGIMNTIVSGIIVGYGAYMELTFTDSTTVNDVTTWSAGLTYGIGPFNFESAQASGKNWSSESDFTGNTVVLQDRSGVPKILAVVVDTPNYSQQPG